MVQADAQELPFEPDTFDCVVFSLCLCTIPRPELAISEALRVAKPGASLLFLEHVRSPHRPIAVLQDLLNPLALKASGDHLNRDSVGLIENMGLSVGLIERWAFGVLALVTATKAPAKI